jgi:hypothetical protein
VNCLKKDMNNQTINECIELQKSYTSENIWEEVSWPSCVCNQNPWYAHHSKPAPLYAHHSHTHHKCVPKEQDFSSDFIYSYTYRFKYLIILGTKTTWFMKDKG